MINILLAVDPWVSSSFPIIRIVLMGIIAACGIAMIVVTLIQSARGETGANAITGATYDSYYMQNKGESKDEILKRITIGLAIAITVLVLLYLTLYAIYPNTGA